MGLKHFILDFSDGGPTNKKSRTLSLGTNIEIREFYSS